MRTSRTMSISSAKVTASAMALRAVFMMSSAGSGVGVEEGGDDEAAGVGTVVAVGLVTV